MGLIQTTYRAHCAEPWNRLKEKGSQFTLVLNMLLHPKCPRSHLERKRTSGLQRTTPLKTALRLATYSGPSTCVQRAPLLTAKAVGEAHRTLQRETSWWTKLSSLPLKKPQDRGSIPAPRRLLHLPLWRKKAHGSPEGFPSALIQMVQL